MGLRISTNMAAINAQRNLGGSTMNIQDSLAKLSSGSRINKSADDAAGLAISETLKAEIRGFRQASRNANDGISLVQTAEGGLNEISNIIVHMRELGVQAASDTVSDVERGFINTESTQLLSEADRIAKSTRFGNKSLLDQEGDELEFHVGPFAGPENVVKANVSADATAGTLGIDGIDLTSKDGARDALGSVDEALVKISKIRADFGAVQSRLQSVNSNTEIQYENLSAAQSRIADADIAEESENQESS